MWRRTVACIQMEIIQLPLNNTFFDMWLRHRVWVRALFSHTIRRVGTNYHQILNVAVHKSTLTWAHRGQVSLVLDAREQRRSILSRFPRKNAGVHGMRWYSRDDKTFARCTIPASRTIGKLVFNFIVIAYPLCNAMNIFRLMWRHWAESVYL